MLNRERTRAWQKLLFRPNITEYIALSKLRCVITFVSLVLLVTDIPRTGLGVRNLQEYYPPPLMPSTAVRFGPFNYPVAHIWRTGNRDGTAEFAGLEGTQPINAARVWYYQYDTTSVGLRGAAELLSVTEFPAFLLYRDSPKYPPENADSFLDLGTTFTMLDAFISAAHSELRLSLDGAPRTLRYATKHNFVDRFHDYVEKVLSKHAMWSLHSLHTRHGANSPSICSSSVVGKPSPPRPRFCNYPGTWKCPNPLNESLGQVHVWQHIDLRLQYLQQRYSDLELDVALISTQRPMSTSGAWRSTFYTCEALEIVVLTRGRHCARGPGESESCVTVFVDDYRYELDDVQTNLVDWYSVVAMLRGGAQTYVWIRLLLLGYGAFKAVGNDGAQSTSVQTRLLTAGRVVLRIPFHVIVYSSPIPVAGYVMALFLDSNFMDIFQETYWASIGGEANFRFVKFIESTAVQMRSVWLLALLASSVVLVARNSRDNENKGMLGVRGLLISFTSSLTVFGPYKNSRYRDTNIVTIFRLTHQGQVMDSVLTGYGKYFNASSYIFDDSARMILFCVSSVVVFALFVQTLVGCWTPQDSFSHRITRGIVLKSSAAAPCGVHKLWTKSLSNIYFDVIHQPQVDEDKGCVRGTNNNGLQRGVARHLHSIRFNTIDVVPAQPTLRRPTTAWEIAEDEVRPLYRHQRTHTAKVHPTKFTSSISSTAAARSTLQLMNIAMMTDPLNFFCLRVLGIQLFLYRINPTNTRIGAGTNEFSLSSYVVILPYAADEMEECTNFCPDEYELLDSASSQDVPLTILLQCG